MTAYVYNVDRTVDIHERVPSSYLDFLREKGADFYRRRVTSEPRFYGEVHVVLPGANHSKAWHAVTR